MGGVVGVKPRKYPCKDAQRGWTLKSTGCQGIDPIEQRKSHKAELKATNELSVKTFNLIIKLLDPISRDKTETASRVRSGIELILSFAKVLGYRAESHFIARASWPNTTKAKYTQSGKTSFRIALCWIARIYATVYKLKTVPHPKPYIYPVK